MKNSKSKKQTLIGYCGVDSGQILLCDPCYIESEWKHDDKEIDFSDTARKKYQGEFSYQGCCLATTDTKNQGGQLLFKNKRTGAGVAITSGLGDGLYPVYAKYDKDGRVSEVIIKF